MLALKIRGLALHETVDDLEPLAAVFVTDVMLRKTDAGFFQLGLEPGIDHVERETPLADVLDAEGHLGEHDRMIETRLDRRDDLDALGQRRRRCAGGPCLEDVVLLVARIDGVLGEEDRVEAGPLRAEYDLAGKREGGLHSFLAGIGDPFSPVRCP